MECSQSKDYQAVSVWMLPFDFCCFGIQCLIHDNNYFFQIQHFSDLERISLTVFISVAGAFIVGRYPTMSFVISSSLRAWMLKPVHPGIFWLTQSVFRECSQRKFFLSASLLWACSSSVTPPVLSDWGPTLSP